MKRNKLVSILSWIAWFVFTLLIVLVTAVLWEMIGSDFVANAMWFFVALTVAWLIWLLSRRDLLISARSFFGTGLDARIYAYISAHADLTTTTQRVITAVEFDAIVSFQNRLYSQFDRRGPLATFLRSVAQLSEFDLQTPTVIIQASPLENQSLSSDETEKSWLLIGGPVRNTLTETCLSSGTPWLTFDRDAEKFIICRGVKAGEHLEPSGQMAVLNRMLIDGRTVIVAFGFGETHTKAAVEFLAEYWHDLDREFNDREFGVCLLIGNAGHAAVHMKLADGVFYKSEGQPHDE